MKLKAWLRSVSRQTSRIQNMEAKRNHHKGKMKILWEAQCRSIEIVHTLQAD